MHARTYIIIAINDLYNKDNKISRCFFGNYFSEILGFKI